MSRLASGIIEAARDRSSAFGYSAQPPGPIYRYLADYCGKLQGKMAQIDPSLTTYEVVQSYLLPIDPFDDGLALGDHRRITSITVVDPVTRNPRRTMPVPLLHRDQRFARNTPGGYAWQEGANLYLSGPSSKWRDYNEGTVEITVIAPFGDVEVAALQAPTATLPLPDEAALAAIEMVAAFMARRTPGMDSSKQEAVAMEAQEEFLKDFASRGVGIEFFTIDEYDPATDLP